jgi:archaellum component FlaC
MISLLENEIKSLKQSTIEMKKKMDNDRQELEKTKLDEKLKTDMNQELKTQVSIVIIIIQHGYLQIPKMQVSDLKQELSQLRKSNHNLQSKTKRLGSNYGRYIYIYIADFI